VQTLWIIVQMIVISAGLLAIVGAIFYAFCWAVLMLLPYFPLIGKRHRHKEWNELNKRSGRQ
jgi:hypothetical protein